MKTIELKSNHEYRFVMSLLNVFDGVVLGQVENWVKIRYTKTLFRDGKVAYINLEKVMAFREM